MNETQKQPSETAANAQTPHGYSQYQHQTLLLDNTLGLVFMSLVAFILLIGLLRQQARYHKLATQLSQTK